MAYVYAKLIRKGTINPKTGNCYVVEDVPDSIRDEVKRILEEEQQ